MSDDRYNEEAAALRRRQLIREARRRKQKQLIIRRLIKKAAVPVSAAILLLLLFFVGKGMLNKSKENKEISEQINTGADTINVQSAQEQDFPPSEAVSKDAIGEVKTALMPSENEEVQTLKKPMATENTQLIGGEVISSYAVILDPETGNIVAQRGAEQRINPASMTKILTVLVAAEQVKNLDDTFTITREITDYSYVNDCSNVGFEENETVTVRDLFYGTILASGADAAAGLAMYTAGSLDAFVELMNDKLDELGLSDTAHFTNCVGLYDENHYCSVTDMALILEAAMENELCRAILSAHTYTTTATAEHEEGLTISNWFLRRIEDSDVGGEVLYAKTGYVVQSGNCAASYAVDKQGKGYICVTADANSGWRCIYDHVALYQQFLNK